MKRHLAFTAVAAIVAATPAAAQGRHDGFTVSVGVGGGSAGATCEGCSTDRQKAPSLYLRLGGAVRPNLVIAGELNGWTKQESSQGFDATITIATVNAVAQWFPQPTGGFFVSGGVGLGSIEVALKANNIGTLSNRTNGLGFQVGTGYDIQLTRGFALTPFATYFTTAGGKVESSGEKINGNVLQAGLGFTWP